MVVELVLAMDMDVVVEIGVREVIIVSELLSV